MKFTLKLLIIFTFLQSCSNENSSVELKSETPCENQLEEIDYVGFRRMYHGIDTLFGKEYEVFMDRNPELNSDFEASDHPFYAALIEQNIILNGSLNLSEIDTLPEQFDYQLSTTKTLKVKSERMKYSEDLESPSFQITFSDETGILLIDTLAYKFPLDVTFFLRDLNNDGTDELVAIENWYFMNGDCYDMMIYNFKKCLKKNKY